MDTATKQTFQKQLPEFVAKGSCFSDFFQQDAEQLNIAAQDRLDLLRQMFVDTATWGLKYWEIFLGIPVDETISVEIRRASVKAKIQACKVLTVERLRALFESFGFQVESLIEDYPQYRIQVRTNDAPKQYPELMAFAKALQVVFPAHLDLIVVANEALLQTEVDIDEIGWTYLSPDEKYLYVLGEAREAGNMYSALGRVYKYDAKTLEKICVWNFAATYPNTEWWAGKASATVSNEYIYIPISKRTAAVDPEFKTNTVQYLLRIDTTTGAINQSFLHDILGEPHTVAGNMNPIDEQVCFHFDANDYYLYVIYRIGVLNASYDSFSDTRQAYAVRLDPNTMQMLSKTLIPKATQIEKSEVINAASSNYLDKTQTVWYSDSYGVNFQIIRGIAGDYLFFFDRMIKETNHLVKVTSASTVVSTPVQGTYRRNPRALVLNLSTLRIKEIYNAEILDYGRRAGVGPSWTVYYRNSKTNMSDTFGIPIHFPMVYCAGAADDLDINNLPQYRYKMLSLDPVSYGKVCQYDIAGNTTAIPSYQEFLPKNVTADMSLWMYSNLDPSKAYAPYFTYGVTTPLDSSSHPYTNYAYKDIVFGILRYPFTAYETGGVKTWEEHVTVGLQFFSTGGQNGGGNPYRSEVYSAQNNVNLVYYMYDTRGFGSYGIHEFSNPPQRMGRKLVRTPARQYQQFRLWSLLGY